METEVDIPQSTAKATNEREVTSDGECFKKTPSDEKVAHEDEEEREKQTENKPSEKSEDKDTSKEVTFPNENDKEAMDVTLETNLEKNKGGNFDINSTLAKRSGQTISEAIESEVSLSSAIKEGPEAIARSEKEERQEHEEEEEEEKENLPAVLGDVLVSTTAPLNIHDGKERALEMKDNSPDKEIRTSNILVSDSRNIENVEALKIQETSSSSFDENCKGIAESSEKMENFPVHDESSGKNVVNQGAELVSEEINKETMPTLQSEIEHETMVSENSHKQDHPSDILCDTLKEERNIEKNESSLTENEEDSMEKVQTKALELDSAEKENSITVTNEGDIDPADTVLSKKQDEKATKEHEIEGSFSQTDEAEQKLFEKPLNAMLEATALPTEETNKDGAVLLVEESSKEEKKAEEATGAPNIDKNGIPGEAYEGEGTSDGEYFKKTPSDEKIAQKVSSKQSADYTEEEILDKAELATPENNNQPLTNKKLEDVEETEMQTKNIPSEKTEVIETAKEVAVPNKDDKETVDIITETNLEKDKDGNFDIKSTTLDIISGETIPEAMGSEVTLTSAIKEQPEVIARSEKEESQKHEEEEEENLPAVPGDVLVSTTAPVGIHDRKGTALEMNDISTDKEIRTLTTLVSDKSIENVEQAPKIEETSSSSFDENYKGIAESSERMKNFPVHDESSSNNVVDQKSELDSKEISKETVPTLQSEVEHETTVSDNSHKEDHQSDILSDTLKEEKNAAENETSLTENEEDSKQNVQTKALEHESAEKENSITATDEGDVHHADIVLTKKQNEKATEEHEIEGSFSQTEESEQKHLEKPLNVVLEDIAVPIEEEYLKHTALTNEDRAVQLVEESSKEEKKAEEATRAQNIDKNGIPGEAREGKGTFDGECFEKTPSNEKSAHEVSSIQSADHTEEEILDKVELASPGNNHQPQTDEKLEDVEEIEMQTEIKPSEKSEVKETSQEVAVPNQDDKETVDVTSETNLEKDKEGNFKIYSTLDERSGETISEATESEVTLTSAIKEEPEVIARSEKEESQKQEEEEQENLPAVPRDVLVSTIAPLDIHDGKETALEMNDISTDKEIKTSTTLVSKKSVENVEEAPTIEDTSSSSFDENYKGIAESSERMKNFPVHDESSGNNVVDQEAELDSEEINKETAPNLQSEVEHETTVSDNSHKEDHQSDILSDTLKEEKNAAENETSLTENEEDSKQNVQTKALEQDSAEKENSITARAEGDRDHSDIVLTKKQNEKATEEHEIEGSFSQREKAEQKHLEKPLIVVLEHAALPTGKTNKDGAVQLIEESSKEEKKADKAIGAQSTDETGILGEAHEGEGTFDGEYFKKTPSDEKIAQEVSSMQSADYTAEKILDKAELATPENNNQPQTNEKHEDVEETAIQTENKQSEKYGVIETSKEVAAPNKDDKETVDVTTEINLEKDKEGNIKIKSTTLDERSGETISEATGSEVTLTSAIKEEPEVIARSEKEESQRQEEEEEENLSAVPGDVLVSATAPLEIHDGIETALEMNNISTDKEIRASTTLVSDKSVEKVEEAPKIEETSSTVEESEVPLASAIKEEPEAIPQSEKEESQKQDEEEEEEHLPVVLGDVLVPTTAPLDIQKGNETALETNDSSPDKEIRTSNILISDKSIENVEAAPKIEETSNTLFDEKYNGTADSSEKMDSFPVHDENSGNNVVKQGAELDSEEITKETVPTLQSEIEHETNVSDNSRKENDQNDIFSDTFKEERNAEENESFLKENEEGSKEKAPTKAMEKDSAEKENSITAIDEGDINEKATEEHEIEGSFAHTKEAEQKHLEKPLVLEDIAVPAQQEHFKHTVILNEDAAVQLIEESSEEEKKAGEAPAHDIDQSTIPGEYHSEVDPEGTAAKADNFLSVDSCLANNSHRHLEDKDREIQDEAFKFESKEELQKANEEIVVHPDDMESEMQDDIFNLESKEQLEKPNEVSTQEKRHEEEKYIMSMSAESKISEDNADEGTTSTVTTCQEGDDKIENFSISRPEERPEIKNVEETQMKTSDTDLQESRVESNDTKEITIDNAAATVDAILCARDETIKQNLPVLSNEAMQSEMTDENISQAEGDVKERNFTAEKAPNTFGSLETGEQFNEQILDNAVQESPMLEDEETEVKNLEDVNQQIPDDSHLTDTSSGLMISKIDETDLNDEDQAKAPLKEVNSPMEDFNRPPVLASGSTALETDSTDISLNKALDTLVGKSQETLEVNNENAALGEIAVHQIVEEASFAQTTKEIMGSSTLLRAKEVSLRKPTQSVDTEQEDRPGEAFSIGDETGSRDVSAKLLQENISTQKKEPVHSLADISRKYDNQDVIIQSDTNEENEKDLKLPVEMHETSYNEEKTEIQVQDKQARDKQDIGVDTDLEDKPGTTSQTNAIEELTQKEEIIDAHSQEENLCYETERETTEDEGYTTGKAVEIGLEAADLRCKCEISEQHYIEKEPSTLSHTINEEIKEASAIEDVWKDISEKDMHHNVTISDISLEPQKEEAKKICAEATVVASQVEETKELCAFYTESPQKEITEEINHNEIASPEFFSHNKNGIEGVLLKEKPTPNDYDSSTHTALVEQVRLEDSEGKTSGRNFGIPTIEKDSLLTKSGDHDCTSIAHPTDTMDRYSSKVQADGLSRSDEDAVGNCAVEERTFDLGDNRDDITVTGEKQTARKAETKAQDKLVEVRSEEEERAIEAIEENANPEEYHNEADQEGTAAKVDNYLSDKNAVDSCVSFKSFSHVGDTKGELQDKVFESALSEQLQKVDAEIIVHTVGEDSKVQHKVAIFESKEQLQEVDEVSTEEKDHIKEKSAISIGAESKIAEGNTEERTYLQESVKESHYTEETMIETAPATVNTTLSASDEIVDEDFPRFSSELMEPKMNNEGTSNEEGDVKDKNFTSEKAQTGFSITETGEQENEAITDDTLPESSTIKVISNSEDDKSEVGQLEEEEDEQIAADSHFTDTSLESTVSEIVEAHVDNDSEKTVTQDEACTTDREVRTGEEAANLSSQCGSTEQDYMETAASRQSQTINEEVKETRVIEDVPKDITSDDIHHITNDDGSLETQIEETKEKDTSKEKEIDHNTASHESSSHEKNIMEGTTVKEEPVPSDYDCSTQIDVREDSEDKPSGCSLDIPSTEKDSSVTDSSDPNSTSNRDPAEEINLGAIHLEYTMDGCSLKLQPRGASSNDEDIANISTVQERTRNLGENRDNGTRTGQKKDESEVYNNVPYENPGVVQETEHIVQELTTCEITSVETAEEIKNESALPLAMEQQDIGTPKGSTIGDEIPSTRTGEEILKNNASNVAESHKISEDSILSVQTKAEAAAIDVNDDKTTEVSQSNETKETEGLKDRDAVSQEVGNEIKDFNSDIPQVHNERDMSESQSGETQVDEVTRELSESSEIDRHDGGKPQETGMQNLETSMDVEALGPHTETDTTVLNKDESAWISSDTEQIITNDDIEAVELNDEKTPKLNESSEANRPEEVKDGIAHKGLENENSDNKKPTGTSMGVEPPQPTEAEHPSSNQDGTTQNSRDNINPVEVKEEIAVQPEYYDQECVALKTVNDGQSAEENTESNEAVENLECGLEEAASQGSGTLVDNTMENEEHNSHLKTLEAKSVELVEKEEDTLTLGQADKLEAEYSLKIPEDSNQEPKEPKINKETESVQKESSETESDEKKSLCFLTESSTDHQVTSMEDNDRACFHNHSEEDSQEKTGTVIVMPEADSAEKASEECSILPNAKMEDVANTACNLPEETAKEEDKQTADFQASTKVIEETRTPEAQLQENTVNCFDANPDERTQQADDESKIALKGEELDSTTFTGALGPVSSLITNYHTAGRDTEITENQHKVEESIQLHGVEGECADEASREKDANQITKKLDLEDTEKGIHISNTNTSDIKRETREAMDINATEQSQISSLSKAEEQPQEQSGSQKQNQVAAVTMENIKDENAMGIQSQKEENTDNSSLKTMTEETCVLEEVSSKLEASKFLTESSLNFDTTGLLKEVKTTYEASTPEPSLLQKEQEATATTGDMRESMMEDQDQKEEKTDDSSSERTIEVPCLSEAVSGELEALSSEIEVSDDFHPKEELPIEVRTSEEASRPEHRDASPLLQVEHEVTMTMEDSKDNMMEDQAFKEEKANDSSPTKTTEETHLPDEASDKPEASNFQSEPGKDSYTKEELIKEVRTTDEVSRPEIRHMPAPLQEEQEATDIVEDIKERTLEAPKEEKTQESLLEKITEKACLPEVLSRELEASNHMNNPHKDLHLKEELLKEVTATNEASTPEPGDMPFDSPLVSTEEQEMKRATEISSEEIPNEKEILDLNDLQKEQIYEDGDGKTSNEASNNHEKTDTSEETAGLSGEEAIKSEKEENDRRHLDMASNQLGAEADQSSPTIKEYEETANESRIEEVEDREEITKECNQESLNEDITELSQQKGKQTIEEHTEKEAVNVLRINANNLAAKETSDLMDKENMVKDSYGETDIKEKDKSIIDESVAKAAGKETGPTLKENSESVAISAAQESIETTNEGKADELPQTDDPASIEDNDNYFITAEEVVYVAQVTVSPTETIQEIILEKGAENMQNKEQSCSTLQKHDRTESVSEQECTEDVPGRESLLENKNVLVSPIQDEDLTAPTVHCIIQEDETKEPEKQQHEPAVSPHIPDLIMHSTENERLDCSAAIESEKKPKTISQEIVETKNLSENEQIVNSTEKITILALPPDSTVETSQRTEADDDEIQDENKFESIREEVTYAEQETKDISMLITSTETLSTELRDKSMEKIFHIVESPEAAQSKLAEVDQWEETSEVALAIMSNDKIFPVKDQQEAEQSELTTEVNQMEETSTVVPTTTPTDKIFPVKDQQEAEQSELTAKVNQTEEISKVVSTTVPTDKIFPVNEQQEAEQNELTAEVKQTDETSKVVSNTVPTDKAAEDMEVDKCSNQSKEPGEIETDSNQEKQLKDEDHLREKPKETSEAMDSEREGTTHSVEKMGNSAMVDEPEPSTKPNVSAIEGGTDGEESRQKDVYLFTGGTESFPNNTITEAPEGPIEANVLTDNKFKEGSKMEEPANNSTAAETLQEKTPRVVAEFSELHQEDQHTTKTGTQENRGDDHGDKKETNEKPEMEKKTKLDDDKFHGTARDVKEPQEHYDELLPSSHIQDSCKKVSLNQDTEKLIETTDTVQDNDQAAEAFEKATEEGNPNESSQIMNSAGNKTVYLSSHELATDILEKNEMGIFKTVDGRSVECGSQEDKGDQGKETQAKPMLMVSNTVEEDKKKRTLPKEEDEVEETKKDEEKEEEEVYEHEELDSGSNAPHATETLKDRDTKTAHKKSHNILAGVGSKVKNSISKVKKAMSCTSSQFSEEDMIPPISKSKRESR